MTTIGYIRVSSDKQDLEKQKHLLWEYAQTHQLLIDDFLPVEISSQKSQRERRIDELLQKLSAGDTLIVAELSRLGRNMLETLNLVNTLIERDIHIIFVRQPELSTTGAHGQLLLAIYGYFAQTEREYISVRTKQGLAAARAQGKILGRPKGSRNKQHDLHPFKADIFTYLEHGLSISGIRKLINPRLDEPRPYNAHIRCGCCWRIHRRAKFPVNSLEIEGVFSEKIPLNLIRQQQRCACKNL